MALWRGWEMENSYIHLFLASWLHLKPMGAVQTADPV